jgi:hypothetical protein
VPAGASVQATSASASGTAVANVEINPEFLAALPPQIQEELLTQQRIEQQARAAAAAQNAAAAAGESFCNTFRICLDTFWSEMCDCLFFLSQLPNTLPNIIILSNYIAN